MDNKTLKFIGAALYACEGTKARRDYRSENRYIRSIELTNSDPKIISAFSLFLRKIIKADWKRVRGQLFIYPDLDEAVVKRFWSKASKVPLEQFQQSIVLRAKEGKFKANPYGTLKIRYSCKADFIKLERIIENLWEEVGV